MDDASGFQELVLANLHSLHNYARLLARQADEAEDLLQEGLLRAFKHFGDFDPTLSFKPWMFTILKRAHIDRYRRRTTREREGRAPTAPPLDDPLYTIPVAPEEILLRREEIGRSLSCGTSRGSPTRKSPRWCNARSVASCPACTAGATC